MLALWHSARAKKAFLEKIFKKYQITGDNCVKRLLKLAADKDITVIRGDSATGKTKGTYMQYSKEHIAKFYLQNKNVQKILKEIEL